MVSESAAAGVSCDLRREVDSRFRGSHGVPEQSVDEGTRL